MKITKKDLIDLTYQKTGGINKNIVSFVVGEFLNELFDILSKNEEIDIEIRGFGVFKKRKREEVVIQNPKTKEKKIYNNLYSVKFKMSKANK